jgi:hypothetical protein
VEVDEAYVSGLEEGLRGRRNAGKKALVVIAAQAKGRNIGRNALPEKILAPLISTLADAA